MTNEAIFAARVARINKTARKSGRSRRRRRSRSFGSLLITPLMLALFMSGGMVYAWDAMDRPTDSPLDMAHILTEQVLSF